MNRFGIFFGHNGPSVVLYSGYITELCTGNCVAGHRADLVVEQTALDLAALAPDFCYPGVCANRLGNNNIFSTGATIMYIYWRVQQDLNEMANTIIFHHPNLVWAFKKWCKKNAAGLRMAEGLGPEELIKKSLSLN